MATRALRGAGRGPGGGLPGPIPSPTRRVSGADPDTDLEAGCLDFESKATHFLIETLTIQVLLLINSPGKSDYAPWGKKMQTESATSTGSDPLKVVADALDTAVQATKDGVEKAQGDGRRCAPAAGEFLSQAAYKTCYGLAFGVVFPTMLIVRSIPKNNAIVHGFVNGAHAAIDSVNEMKAKSAAGVIH